MNKRYVYIGTHSKYNMLHWVYAPAGRALLTTGSCNSDDDATILHAFCKRAVAAKGLKVNIKY